MKLPTLLTLLPLSLCQIVTFEMRATAVAPGGSSDIGGIHANGGYLWLHKPTKSFCPSNVPNCPAGKRTLFTLDEKSKTMAMDVIVPGGQQVFAGPQGRLRYTAPHSAFMPPGSQTVGFGNSTISSTFSELVWKNDNTWWLCPPPGAKQITATTAFRVFAPGHGVNCKNGMLVVMQMKPAKGVGAWEYT